jgi:hypothetical protein
MKIYLINKETKETIQTFENVEKWGKNFVEYKNGNYRAKMYCNENEYFTDQMIEVQNDE